jgi:hypothetical protein
VYLIFVLIDNLSLAPVTSTNYPNNAQAMRESNGQYTTRDTSKTEVSLLLGAAVPGVLSDNAVGVCKCLLRQYEWHAMFALIFYVFARIPFEAGVWHAASLLQSEPLAILLYGCIYGSM